jgi:hypothetical protein
MKHEHIGPWNRNWPQWGGLWKPLGWYNEYDLVLEGEMKLGLAQGGWGIAEALEGGCVKASWYYTYLWKKFHMSEHDYRNYRIEYINISKLRTMESDGGLEYIVDLVWKRLVLKRMMNVKKYDLYRVGKEIETSVLKEYGYEVGDFSEDFWNEEMVRTIHFVNDRRSVWTERDERYMRFVDKGLKWSYLSDFGKFVLEQIATREDWDRVNLIMEFYKVSKNHSVWINISFLNVI